MDKRSESCNRLDVLELKTGINVYRLFVFCSFVMSLTCSVSAIAFNRDITETIISFLLSFAFLLLTVFMDKLVYVLKLPTNLLIISKNEIIYKKRKKQLTFKIDEISYKFHPFYEDFETVSLLVIASNDELFHIAITKKQFNLLERYLLLQKESAE